MLELRAGLSGDSPKSVGQVAEQLGVPRSEVAATQRQALRRLRAQKRSNGCATPSAGAVGPGDVSARRALLTSVARMPRLQPALFLVDAPKLVAARGLGGGDSGDGDSGSDRGRSHGDVRGARASGGSESSGAASASAPPAARPGLERSVATLAGSSTDSGPSPLLLAILAAFGMSVVAAVALRNRDGRVAAGGAGTAGAAATAERSAPTGSTGSAPADALASADDAPAPGPSDSSGPAEPSDAPDDATVERPAAGADATPAPPSPSAPAAAAAATAAGGAREATREEPTSEHEPSAEQESTTQAPPGDKAAAAAPSLDTAAAEPSPGDPAAAPGPPAASAAADAAAGATPSRDAPEDQDVTVVRRRTGGIVGAVKPAGETAARAASSATRRLKDLARRARGD